MLRFAGGERGDLWARYGRDGIRRGGRGAMANFRIQSHGRLQEWVAEEKGYFQDEGLDYEFLVRRAEGWSASVQDAESAPPQVVRGAFESFEAGRACEISSACQIG